MNNIELYERIIDFLVNESAHLTSVLLLLRQLYEKIGDTCPIFVDKELTGYSVGDAIPTYRVIPSMRIFADSQFILGGIDQHRSIPISLQGTYLSKTENEYKICLGPVCEYQDLYAQGRAQTIVETLSDFEAETTSYTNVRVECRSADIARLLNAVRERINDAVHEVIVRHPELCSKHQSIITHSTTTYNTVNITGTSNQVVAGGSDITQTQNIRKQMERWKMLEKVLGQLGISGQDQDELHALLQEESVPVVGSTPAKPGFDQRVIAWFGKIAGNAFAGCYGTRTDSFYSRLSDAVKAYCFAE